MGERKNILRRYTDISALLYLLKNKVITLLDPESWADTNDAYGLAEYKKKRSLESLLALCFVKASENYHHWHVFAHGPAGVCISFKRDELIAHIESVPGIKYRAVTYLMLKEYQSNIDSKNMDDLPFIKRYGFRDEKEFRVIYEDSHDHYETKDICVSLSTIDRVEFNPWIRKSLYESTRDVLMGIDGTNEIRMFRSTLLNNKRWKEIASEIKP